MPIRSKNASFFGKAIPSRGFVVLKGFQNVFYLTSVQCLPFIYFIYHLFIWSTVSPSSCLRFLKTCLSYGSFNCALKWTSSVRKAFWYSSALSLPASAGGPGSCEVLNNSCTSVPGQYSKPPNSTLAAAMLTYTKVLNIFVAVLYSVNNCVLLIAFKLTINERIESTWSSPNSFPFHVWSPRSASVQLRIRSRFCSKTQWHVSGTKMASPYQSI